MQHANACSIATNEQQIELSHGHVLDIHSIFTKRKICKPLEILTLRFIMFVLFHCSPLKVLPLGLIAEGLHHIRNSRWKSREAIFTVRLGTRLAWLAWTVPTTRMTRCDKAASSSLSSAKSYAWIQNDRRKFRSQTSDNMDRWKAELGRGREKRRVEERRSEKRKSQKKADADAWKGRKVAKHCVFPMIWGSGGPKK